MKILCLDPGSNCGWALRDNGRVESGTQVFDLRRGESPGMRFLRFTKWINELLDGFGAGDLVLWEQPPYLRSGPAVDLLIGMTTRIAEAAAFNGCEYKAVGANTLKKSVAGNGRADKSDVGNAVVKHFAHSVVMGDGPMLLRADQPLSEHEYDALALLVWLDLGMPEPARKAKKRKEQL